MLLVVGGLLVVAAVVLVIVLVVHSGNDTSTPARSSVPMRASVHRDFLVGTAVTDDALRDEPRYASTVAHEYNAVTPENALKWDRVQPEQGRFDFGPADTIVDFARAHDMAVRGHTLVWHRSIPSWVTDRKWTRAELEQVLHDYIRQVVGRYRGRIAQWDVVNEAVDDNGNLRDDVWLRTIGPEYIDLAFRWAHEADPAAKLYYNDFDLELPGEKARAVDKLVRGLQSRHVPIDGVGIQGHQTIVRPRSRKMTESALRRYARMGLDVALTEADVAINLPADEAKRREQAGLYRDTLGACLAVASCRAFVTWGFTDAHSWVPGARPGLGDALPFDDTYRPKPALDALRAELAG